MKPIKTKSNHITSLISHSNIQASQTKSIIHTFTQTINQMNHLTEPTKAIHQTINQTKQSQGSQMKQASPPINQIKHEFTQSTNHTIQKTGTTQPTKANQNIQSTEWIKLNKHQ